MENNNQQNSAYVNFIQNLNDILVDYDINQLNYS